MPLKFKNELDFLSFEQFAEENANYAYMQALTATHDDRKAEKLAANALFCVLKNKKHFEAESNDVTEHTAVNLSLRPLLSRKEKDMLDNAPSSSEMFNEFLNDDEGRTEQFRVYPPDEAAKRRIVTKACSKAESITPKYAPMYTGTKSGIILIIVLVFICAAIYFIWSDPVDLLSDKSADYNAQTSAVSIPGSGSLIDIDFVIGQPAQGSVPVQIYISGPDRGNVSSVTYSPENSDVLSSAYQCGDEYWVMMASSNNYYKVNVKGTNGLDVVRHFRVTDAIPAAPEVKVIDIQKNNGMNTLTVQVKTYDGSSNISSSDIIDIRTDTDGKYILNVSEGFDRTVYFTDNAGNQTGLLITAGGSTVISPSLSLKEVSLSHDSSKVINLNELLPSDRTYTISVTPASENLTAFTDSENNLTLTALNGFAGVDSINFTIEDNYGLVTDAAVSVVVENSSPYYADSSQLYATVLHTPSNTGYLFGTLSAADVQNDKLTYKLVNQTDCSVTLSPGGSFMLFIDPDYRGHTASFDFTVSDGLLTCEPYRYTISLHNNIIQSGKFSQKFVCYSGENGWYAIDLPSTDSDGDILNWTVTTELSSDSRTPKGNYISFADGLSTVLIRPDPERNEEFSETLTLTCSDGWLSSDTITVRCSFIENQPPKAGRKNRAEITASERNGVFILDITDDCEFDKCVIKEVVSCTGGKVVPNIGWNTLSFTINFDPVLDEPEPVTAVFLVEDVVTKETIEVTYTIRRITD